jgi:hypothetical protein
VWNLTMADNTELNAGTGGDTIASDDILGVKYQRVKVVLGADGSNDGDVNSANPLPVSGTVTANAGTNLNTSALALEAGGNLAAAAASLATLDNIVAGSEAQVDVLTVPAPLSTTGGGTEATALRVTLATDSTGVVSVDDNGGALTVDGTVSVSGTVTVDSELTTADLDTGAGTDTRAVVGLVGSASGGGQLIPGSSTDGLLVNLGSNNDVTVTGTVTANLAAGTNNIGDVDVLSIAAGDNNIGNVDVVTLPSIPAGTNNIGDVDVLSVVPGTGATSLGKAEDAAHTTGDTGVMALGVRAASPTERSAGPTDGDYEPFALNEVGAVWVSPTASANGGLTIFRSIDLDETEEEVKASAGVVHGMWVTNTATSTRFVKFYNATAANVTVGSTTPVITIGIPGNTSDDVSGVFNVGPAGIGFGTAITVAATTGVADADTGAPGANEVIVNIFYK